VPERRSREPDAATHLSASGLAVRECRDPEGEATRLATARVAVVRTARDGRQLLERLAGHGPPTSRLPRNRALERDRLRATSRPALTAVPPSEPAPPRLTAVPGRVVGQTSPNSRPTGSHQLEWHLRASAAAASHWALHGARTESERLTHEAAMLKRAFGGVGAALALSIIALLVVPGRVTAIISSLAVAGLIYLVLRHRRSTAVLADAKADIEAIGSSILADHGLGPADRAALLPWEILLARNALSRVTPDRVDDAIDELRSRDEPERPRADAVESGPTPDDLRDNPDEGLAVGETTEPDELAPLAIDSVIVLDDGLHVGHRIALRDLSEKIAAMVPVLVLTTNERLWLPPRRAG
jgi:hypothetical protein